MKNFDNNFNPDTFKGTLIKEFPVQPSSTTAIMNKVSHSTLQKIKRPNNLSNVIGPFISESEDYYEGQMLNE